MRTSVDEVALTEEGKHPTEKDKSDLWAAGSGMLGAAVWAGIAVLARMGIARVGAIELMFLFAPLVIVPLGLELGKFVGGSDRWTDAARWIQPVGAGLAVASFWMPPGRTAGVAALGWMVVCVVVAAGGIVRVVRGFGREADRSVRSTLGCSTFVCSPFVSNIIAIGRIDLAVGGAWLVASRLGMRPVGIQEPIGLLTAVHFHFAGFATATIAAATLAFAQGERERPWLGRLVLMVAVLPVVVAAGFVISPGLKMGAAVLFSASVAALAVWVRAMSRRAHDATARVLLQVASVAVFAGMVLSGAYAVADFLGSDALTIPQMARTHGILNAVGFCLAGVLGWIVEFRGQWPVVSD